MNVTFDRTKAYISCGNHGDDLSQHGGSPISTDFIRTWQRNQGGTPPSHTAETTPLKALKSQKTNASSRMVFTVLVYVVKFVKYIHIICLKYALYRSNMHGDQRQTNSWYSNNGGESQFSELGRLQFVNVILLN